MHDPDTRGERLDEPRKISRNDATAKEREDPENGAEIILLRGVIGKRDAR